jgi:hypothetical protein
VDYDSNRGWTSQVSVRHDWNRSPQRPGKLVKLANGTENRN